MVAVAAVVVAGPLRRKAAVAPQVPQVPRVGAAAVGL